MYAVINCTLNDARATLWKLLKVYRKDSFELCEQRFKDRLTLSQSDESFFVGERMWFG